MYGPWIITFFYSLHFFLWILITQLNVFLWPRSRLVLKLKEKERKKKIGNDNVLINNHARPLLWTQMKSSPYKNVDRKAVVSKTRLTAVASVSRFFYVVHSHVMFLLYVISVYPPFLYYILKSAIGFSFEVLFKTFNYVLYFFCFCIIFILFNIIGN